MTLRQMIEFVETLSHDEKHELIEAVIKMLPSSMDNRYPGRDPLANHSAVDEQVNGIADDLNIPWDEAEEEYYDAILRAHLNSPDPEPDQMLRFGMFKGRIPVDEEYFRMAEWRPSDEELTGG